MWTSHRRRHHASHRVHHWSSHGWHGRHWPWHHSHGTHRRSSEAAIRRWWRHHWTAPHTSHSHGGHPEVGWRWWRTISAATSHREHGRHRRHRWTPMTSHAPRWHPTHTCSVFHIHALMIGICCFPGGTFSSAIIRRGCRRIGRSCARRRNLNVIVEIHETGIVPKLIRVEHCSHVAGIHGLRSTGFEPWPAGHAVVESTSTLVCWYHFSGNHFVHPRFSPLISPFNETDS